MHGVLVVGKWGWESSSPASLVPGDFGAKKKKLSHGYQPYGFTNTIRFSAESFTQRISQPETMAPTRTRTVKNKHAGAKPGSAPGGKSGGAKRSASDGISKPSSRGGKKKPTGPPPSQQLKEKNRAALIKKPKKRTYTEAELGIPELNKITPIGVVKPKGKKKGKVFVDDKVRCSPGFCAVNVPKRDAL